MELNTPTVPGIHRSFVIKPQTECISTEILCRSSIHIVTFAPIKITDITESVLHCSLNSTFGQSEEHNNLATKCQARKPTSEIVQISVETMPSPPPILRLANANTTHDKKDLARVVASSPNTTQNKKDPEQAVASSPNITQDKKDPDRAVTSLANTTHDKKDPDRAVASSPNTTQNKKDPDQAVESRAQSNLTIETNVETTSQVKTHTNAAHANDSDSDDDQDEDSGTADEEDNHEDKEREAFIEEHLKDFPCTFNIGKANYNIEKRVFAVETIKQMSCRGIAWENIVDDAIVSSNDDAWIPLEWKQNRRTRAYVELGRLEEARKLIDEILYKTGGQTITATANLAVWYFVQGNVKDALEVVRQLKALSKLKTFRHLKADALCEQAYFYYAISGAENNISGIEIVKFALNYLIKYKSEVTFMMGSMHRRCLHWNTYLFDKDQIDFVEFAKNSWEFLSSVRTMEGVRSILKANALVELAFLKNDVSVVEDVDTESLNFNVSIELLCKEAVELAPGSADVTAIAGQLVKHIPQLKSWAKHLLEVSLEIQPSGRAHHHLGLILLKEANQFEKENHSKLSPKEKQSRDRIRSDSQDISYELSQKGIQRCDTFEWVLDSCLAEGKKIPLFSAHNPFIQDAAENLNAFFNLVSFNRNLPTVVRLGYAYLRCCQYNLASDIYIYFTVYGPNEIPKLVLSYGLKMAAVCFLLNAELAESEEKRSKRRKAASSLLVSSVSIAEEISKEEASKMEPLKFWEVIKNLPKYHMVPPTLFPKL
ncbi:unnamed protein product [Lymnaea stagnalis]|uniref:Uncharacterized protein n=1 Tax=Lymnaea stagnalis TaxID=6523 RepID=A0AAV2ID18_LYMST